MFCCLDFGTTDFPANRRSEGNRHTFAAKNDDIVISSGSSTNWQEQQQQSTRYDGGHIMSLPAPSAPPKDDVYLNSVFSSPRQSTTVGSHYYYSTGADSSLLNPDSSTSELNTPLLQPLTSTTTTGKMSRVLVKVPPGVNPGETLEIKIPEENNRTLQVKVPPNTDKFYVEYESTSQRGAVSTRNGNFDASARNAPENVGNAIDESIIPIIGGAALLGTAGLLIGHHNRGS